MHLLGSFPIPAVNLQTTPRWLLRTLKPLKSIKSEAVESNRDGKNPNQMKDAKAHQKPLEGHPKDSAARQNSTVKNKPGDNRGHVLVRHGSGEVGPQWLKVQV